MLPRWDRRQLASAFTLIELLVVISIISLLISILLPSLSRAREQAKSVHCLARLKEMGNAIATYENMSSGMLPPARWYPEVVGTKKNPYSDEGQTSSRVEYGWTEILYSHIYQEEVLEPLNYPVQRNIGERSWAKYFLCKSAGEDGPSSGHYRVYLPSWSVGTHGMRSDGRYDERKPANPDRGGNRERLRPRMPMIGDANELSERGDGLGSDDCSYIDAGEANYAGSDGRAYGNRFSDRHYGGANFLFQDLHARWDSRLRAELARDFDLNDVVDVDVQP